MSINPFCEIAVEEAVRMKEKGSFFCNKNIRINLNEKELKKTHSRQYNEFSLLDFPGPLHPYMMQYIVCFKDGAASLVEI